MTRNSLNRKEMICAIARKTGLTQRQVKQCLDELLDLWKAELIAGGRIEIENFMIMEVNKIDRGEKHSNVLKHGQIAPRHIYRVHVRTSRYLKAAINRRQNNE